VNKLIERYESLTDRQKKEFKRLVNPDQPMGPYYLNLDGNDNSNQYHQVFFDDSSDYLYKNESRSPALVIGRRGAGKSSYINNLSQQKVAVIPDLNNFPIILNNWELVREVAQRIIELDLFPGTASPEETAKFWELIFYLEIIRELCFSDEYTLPENLDKYIEIFNLKNVSSGVGGLVNSISLSWKNKNDDGGRVITVNSLLDMLMESQQGFTDIRRDINDALYGLGLAAVILLDNPESPLSNRNSASVTEFIHSIDYYTDDALAGLLHLCTTLNANPSSYVQIRMCIPSEQYKHYIGRSSQPERFGYRHLLHWKTSDLLSLVANRVLLFGHIYPEYIDKDIYDELLNLDLGIKSELKKFFSLIFDCEVENGRSDNNYKRNEVPILYIVRHTQLLPRQIIRYMNDIFSNGINNNNSLIIKDPEIIKSGIANIESILAYEIARSYEHSYQGSVEIVKIAMKKFPLVFGATHLEWIYKQNILKDKEIAKIIENSTSLSAVDTVDKFIRMLEAMGAIGKVLGVPEAYKYVNTEFEYNIDGNLITNSETKYSPHPLFSHNIEPGSLHKGAHTNVLGIYPKESGADKFFTEV